MRCKIFYQVFLLTYFSKSVHLALPWKVNTLIASNSAHVKGTLVLTFGLHDQLDEVYSDNFQPGQHYSWSGYLLTATDRRLNSVRFSLRVNTCATVSVLKLKHLQVSFIFKNITYRTVVENVNLEGYCEYQSNRGLVTNGFAWKGTNDCFYHRDYISNGDVLHKGCEAVCKCFNGTTECISMCPPKLVSNASFCRLVAPLKSCCETVECFEDAQIRFCDQKSSNLSSKSDHTIFPWTVVIHSWKRGLCLATIIDERWLITPGYCVDHPDLVLFLYPVIESRRQWRIENVIFSPNVSYGGIEIRKTLALIKLKRPIIFNENIHKVNLPWMGICGNYLKSDCQMKITSFGTIEKSFELDNVKKVETFRCFDNFYYPNSSSYAEICFKKEKKTRYCPTEDGGAVVVHSGSYYYMVGLLRKFFPEPCPSQLDDRGSLFVKAESICPYLQWIQSYTGLQ